MIITPDSQAILSICSHLGVQSNAEYAPLSLKEWNILAKKLQAASMRPGDLLSLPAVDLQSQMDIGAEEANRISQLL